ncbi:uncharacterized protein K452DRAFT_247570 [Aplosporella prunicola CBS 121167]|uniref:AAA+ ATPase domain-containing protein n=1 Tax=Aplosporella prunicola CBS 121167 TaxID=1176127 RepID=A0A6A6BK42_9PEZI|nr:uncharacterized protein K452DRAFT_247570 [Aplosporella prunicola CBS 121167]KAF2143197.1 hypothetical protein K452DRAFT_247570 [Aplosporella prunicola CBS 121167]
MDGIVGRNCGAEESHNKPENYVEDSQTTKGKESTKQIKYRVEYRNRVTNEVVYQHETNGLNDNGSASNAHGLEQPLFELVSTFTTGQTSSSQSEEHSKPILPSTTPSVSMHIYSRAIINAIQSVVEYYPEQDLTGDVVIIRAPYAILVHHYEELSSFRDEIKSKPKEDLCAREIDAYEHVGVLLDFLDGHIMADVRAEQDRNRRGLWTWRMAWVSRRPGATQLTRVRESEESFCMVIKSISGGSFENPSVPWVMEYWRLTYDGEYLGRVERNLIQHKFDGEEEQDTSQIIDLDNRPLTPKVAQHIANGKIYWDLLKKQCKHYRGKTADIPHNEVDGLVMTDLKSYYTDIGNPTALVPSGTDIRNWASDCTCPVCRRRESDSEKTVTSLFEDYDLIVPETFEGNLTDHQFMLLPSYMRAFVFKTRSWEQLRVNNFSAPEFDEGMINHLVMDEKRVKQLKALAKSYARTNQFGQVTDREMWSADFVRGKGKGLTFLLHGQPGVGKTCTAECIAAFTRRPLMVLTCSDIGTEPTLVEANLTRHFKTARSWGAVLLIDEADVFMERRSSDDLMRNSLVAGFLRALEFYDGILFLTTNRVGSFDDAFISRIHVKLYYPEFNDRERQLVWDTFVQKLIKERKGYMRITIDAKQYLKGNEMRAVKWNGREIRNAFQTAVALAEYESIKDEEGNIELTDEHLRAVVEMSRDFKDYIDELHKGDEAKRAERKYERLDSYPTH